MTIDLSQFHQVFFEESLEGLDVMESGLLNLSEGVPDNEEINAIFRAAHSIKGGAGTFDFTEISQFTHLLETLLDEVRSGKRTVTQEMINLLLKSVDVVRTLLKSAQSGDSIEADAGIQQALQAMLVGEKSVAPASTAPSDDSVNDATQVWSIAFHPHENLFKTGNDPIQLIRALSELGEVKVECDVNAVPSFDALDPENCYLSWTLTLTGNCSEIEIREVFDWVEDECDLVVQRQAAEATLPEPAEESAEVLVERRRTNERRRDERRKNEGQRNNDTAQGSIRVGIDKLDELINMVGELVITQSMLGNLGETFTMDKINYLKDGLAELERHTRDLQESVMRIRMVPISFVFSRFPRMVHDLSQKLGKSIDLQIVGEATELDKTVIEHIGDPLTHLVRNSVDHGVETREERIAAGKPETGEVKLNAYHKGGNIIIEISDDGRGLDADKLFAKAVEKGVIDANADLTDEQIHELIFHPGFSTAKEVSDISGRGVGMDVVRKNITRLGGSIELKTALGEGTLCRIRLPLTLAILDGQSVRIGDEIYIVPIASIIESIQLTKGLVNEVSGHDEMFELRGEYLPIVKVSEIFQISNVNKSRDQEGLLVVVEGDGQRYAMLVDELLGQQQVVIKSLETNFRRVQGLSGATIFGDGSVALILDVPGLFRFARQSESESLSD